MKADKKENDNGTKLYLQSLKMFWDSNKKCHRSKQEKMYMLDNVFF